MRGFQGTPAQTGKEGLFRLVEQVYVSYKEEIETRPKSYRRYVLGFILSKRFHDATWQCSQWFSTGKGNIGMVVIGYFWQGGSTEERRDQRPKQEQHQPE